MHSPRHRLFGATQKLSWIRKAAQKLSHTVADTPRTAALTAGKAETPPRRLLHVSPKRPPADTDAEQQCPRPPVDSHPLADIASPAAISPVVSSLRDDVSEPSPAVLRLRALRQRAVSPEAARKRRSTLRCAAPDSATSLNSARGARAKDPAARRRNSLAGMELGAILLSPDKAACLASASCKVGRHIYLKHITEKAPRRFYRFPMLRVVKRTSSVFKVGLQVLMPTAGGTPD